MNIINKIEDLFNSLFYKLTASSKKLAKGVTSDRHKRKLSRRKDAVEEKRVTLIQRTKIHYQSSIKSFKQKKEILNPGRITQSIKTYIDGLEKQLPKEYQGGSSQESAEESSPKKPGKLKKILLLLTLITKQLKKSLQHYFKKHSTAIVSLFIVLVPITVFFLAQGDFILKKMGVISPSAPAPDLSVTRKSYHKLNYKQITLTNVQLPVHFVNINEIRRTDIEFTVTCSNRFTKNYISKYEYKLRDHLYTSVEPLVPSFPLEDEGKMIIKEKIQKEIDNFLKKNLIRGKADDVHVRYILSI